MPFSPKDGHLFAGNVRGLTLGDQQLKYFDLRSLGPEKYGEEAIAGFVDHCFTVPPSLRPPPLLHQGSPGVCGEELRWIPGEPKGCHEHPRLGVQPGEQR